MQTTNVLVEDTITRGASDAGLYVGQSREVIAGRNLAEFNVAGIEIENTIHADVYDNVATNNTLFRTSHCFRRNLVQRSVQGTPKSVSKLVTLYLER